MKLRYGVAGLTAALMLGGAALAQSPIGSLDRSGGVTIEGRVTDVFGNKFVLEDSSGRTLVETGPAWHSRIEVRTGERLKVVGRPENGGFDAFRITRESGQEIVVRSADGPPPWAGRPKHDRRAERDYEPTRFAMGDLEKRLKDRGYTMRGEAERKPKHVEVVAQNSRGEMVELHIGLDGDVYKERMLRNRR